MDLRDYLLSGPSFYVSPGCLQSHQLALEVLSLSINSAGSRTSGLLAKSLLFLVMNNVQFAFLLIDCINKYFQLCFSSRYFLLAVVQSSRSIPSSKPIHLSFVDLS